MRICIVFLVCLTITMSGGQEDPPADGLSVNVDARSGAANGQASSSQSRSGQGMKVGGSAPSSAQSSSNGNSQAQAEASGLGKTGERQGLVGGGPVQTGVVYPPIVEGGDAPPQDPGVWDALDALRGKPALQAEEIQAILATAQEGVDYPNLAEIPDQTNFNCANVKQAGFYADSDSRCQVFRRCDIDGVQTSYLCPNKTVFNQIVLVCDWFFNVDCANSAKFYDYSNSRLYHANWVLLDTPPEKVDASAQSVAAGQASAS